MQYCANCCHEIAPWNHADNPDTCPYCGSDEVVEMEQCRECGRWFPPYEYCARGEPYVDDGLCDDCRRDVQRDFGAWLGALSCAQRDWFYQSGYWPEEEIVPVAG